MSEMTLPEGWCKTDIGSYIYLKNGYAFKSNEYTTPSESSFPVIRISDLDGVTASEKDAVYVLNGAAGFEVQNGDLLIAMSGATTGKIGLYNGQEPAYQNQRVGNLKFHSNKYSCEGFRNYLIQYLRDDILKIAYGGAQPNISGKAIEDMLISLPPLAEQKVIADQLDALLAQVERTKARLERVPDILKQFRQSVLAAAVSGKLTEGWREENYYNFFDSNISGLKVFRDQELRQLPANWAWLRFDQVADIASNLMSPLDFPNDIHIAPNHIESGSGCVSGYQTILADAVTSPKHRFFKGQILYSKIRPYLCKVALAEFTGLCSADMYPINSKILTTYLYRWMLTPQFTDWASNAESRSVLPKINQKDLSQIPVPTPPLEEQTEIVRRVETLFAHADKIEQQAQAGLARVNQLTQSILAKAFRGELTTQWRKDNPELISGENSAEALLVKIRAEKSAMGGKKIKKTSA